MPGPILQTKAKAVRESREALRSVAHAALNFLIEHVFLMKF